jgi:hypothetical protein
MNNLTPKDLSELEDMISKHWGIIVSIGNIPECVQMIVIRQNKNAIWRIVNPTEKTKQYHKMLWEI